MSTIGERLQKFADEHYADWECRVEQFAAQEGLQVRTCQRHLDKEGVSFMETMVKTRLANACKQLADTDTPLWKIAHNVGYRNIPQFSRVFRERMDCTPTQYREERRGR